MVDSLLALSSHWRCSNDTPIMAGDAAGGNTCSSARMATWRGDNRQNLSRDKKKEECLYLLGLRMVVWNEYIASKTLSGQRLCLIKTCSQCVCWGLASPSCSRVIFSEPYVSRKSLCHPCQQDHWPPLMLTLARHRHACGGSWEALLTSRSPQETNG